jgi:hypothetical protein
MTPAREMKAREREAGEREEREVQLPDPEESFSLKPSSYPRLEVSPLDNTTPSPTSR